MCIWCQMLNESSTNIAQQILCRNSNLFCSSSRILFHHGYPGLNVYTLWWIIIIYPTTRFFCHKSYYLIRTLSNNSLNKNFSDKFSIAINSAQSSQICSVQIPKMKVFFVLCLVLAVFADDEESSVVVTESSTEESQSSTEASPSSTEASPASTEAHASTNSCDPWPKYLKSVQECCSIPFHSNTMLQHVCYTKCMSRPKDLQNDCVANCYVNMTGIIRGSTINKPAVRRIYEGNSFHDRKWSKLVGDAVEKCEYSTGGTLPDNLMKFFNCVDDFLVDHCVSFSQTPECDATEEHFETCKNIQPNCTAWPINMIHPEACCKIPQILSEELSSKCRISCQRKELFLPRQVECINNCTYIHTGLRANGKIVFEVAKKMLIESSNNTAEWEKPIEAAVAECEKLMKGEKRF